MSGNTDDDADVPSETLNTVQCTLLQVISTSLSTFLSNRLMMGKGVNLDQYHVSENQEAMRALEQACETRHQELDTTCRELSSHALVSVNREPLIPQAMYPLVKITIKTTMADDKRITSPLSFVRQVFSSPPRQNSRRCTCPQEALLL